MNRQTRTHELDVRIDRLETEYASSSEIDLDRLSPAMAKYYLDLGRRIKLNIAALTDDELEYCLTMIQIASGEPISDVDTQRLELAVLGFIAAAADEAK